MATVMEMIKWFNTLPPDAIVEVGAEVTESYQTYMEMAEVEIDACEVFDYSSDEDRRRYPMMDGKIFIQLKTL